MSSQNKKKIKKKKNKRKNKNNYKGKNVKLNNGTKQASKTKTKQAHSKNKRNKNSNGNKSTKLCCIRGITTVPLAVYTKKGQTFPPTVAVNKLWLNADYTISESQTLPHPCKDSKDRLRMESNELKAIENNAEWQKIIQECREGAQVHRQVRQAAQHFIQPGMSMVEICEFIERSVSLLVGFQSKKPMLRGWGFPTGCSLNSCAAHYTPNPGDKTRLKLQDLCKIDFGVQVNGHIIDSAFSLSFDAMHDQLMEAVKAATNRGVQVMGIGARLGEIGAEIQEVMESYEAVYNGNTYPVKCIRNLNGHNIGPWVIHDGKTVPIVKTEDQTKMEEGELFAIETFGSVMGKGFVTSEGECSHFAMITDTATATDSNTTQKQIQIQNQKLKLKQIQHAGARNLYKFLNQRFGSLPFCRRWLDNDGQKRHLLSLKHLVESEVVRAYPPLCEVKGAFTAQYEHTILLKPTSKEVLSRGFDY